MIDPFEFRGRVHFYTSSNYDVPHDLYATITEGDTSVWVCRCAVRGAVRVDPKKGSPITAAGHSHRRHLLRHRRG